jgi:hypothetical protein
LQRPSIVSSGHVIALPTSCVLTSLNRSLAPPLRNVVVMETLRGFPNLPALWLRQAKPACAYAFGIQPQTAGAPPYVLERRYYPPARRA